MLVHQGVRRRRAGGDAADHPIVPGAAVRPRIHRTRCRWRRPTRTSPGTGPGGGSTSPGSSAPSPADARPRPPEERRKLAPLAGREGAFPPPGSKKFPPPREEISPIPSLRDETELKRRRRQFAAPTAHAREAGPPDPGPSSSPFAPLGEENPESPEAPEGPRIARTTAPVEIPPAPPATPPRAAQASPATPASDHAARTAGLDVVMLAARLLALLDWAEDKMGLARRKVQELLAMACPERVALVIEYVELLKARGLKVGGIGYLVDRLRDWKHLTTVELREEVRGETAAAETRRRPGRRPPGARPLASRIAGLAPRREGRWHVDPEEGPG